MKRIECTSCHVTLEIEDDYFEELKGQGFACPECAASIQIPGTRPLTLRKPSLHARACPQCKRPLPSDAVLCIQCGYDTRTGRKVARAGLDSSTQGIPKSALWGGLAAVLLVAGVGAAIVSASRSKPQLSPAQTPAPEATPPRADSTQTQPPQSSTRTVSTEQQTKPAFSAPSSIKGTIHITFQGYDLPLKQVPVYLIPVSAAFGQTYNTLAQEALPLLKAQSEAPRNSRDWLRATQALIDVEKRRAVAFRQHTSRTLYTDNNGMFAFHDLESGRYMVFVEGTIKDRITIWASVVDLSQGDSKLLDFGESTVGGNERVYAFADVPAEDSPKPASSTPQYTGDQLCDMGIAAANRGDQKKAVQLFATGAEAGHALCQYNLGASYIDGLGVAQDYKQAVYWYSQAAKQGLAVAQKKLGLCYYRGAGVGEDVSKAVYWFGEAAKQGDEEAGQALNELLYADSKARGAQKNPPDRDAAERFLTQAADTMVQMKINNGELIGARRVGFQFQYVKGNPRCDANAQVDYEFTFTTRAGLTRRNVGYLFFYHDPGRRDWFNSDTNIDGLPRY